MNFNDSNNFGSSFLLSPKIKFHLFFRFLFTQIPTFSGGKRDFVDPRESVSYSANGRSME